MLASILAFHFCASLYVYEISRQLKRYYIINHVNTLPHFLTHKIFKTACHLEIADKFSVYDTELKKAVLSLHRVFLYKTRRYTRRMYYLLDAHIRLKLSIPDGCADDEYLEYVPLLEMLIYTNYNVIDLIALVEAHSNIDAVLKLCSYICQYPYTPYWTINYVWRYSSKQSVVKSIIKLLTCYADHPSCLTYKSSGNNDNYMKIWNVIEVVTDGYHDEDGEFRYVNYGGIFHYIASSMSDRDMREDVFSQYGRFNSRNRDHSKYHFDDLMRTVKGYTIDDLVDLLSQIRQVVNNANAPNEGE